MDIGGSWCLDVRDIWLGTVELTVQMVTLMAFS